MYARKRFDAVDDERRAQRREDLERVLRARHLGVDDGDAGAGEGLDEAPRLGDGNERVAVAVDDEEGRGARGDAAHRRGAMERVGRSAKRCLITGARGAQEPGVPVVPVAVGEVVDAVERHAGADRCVDVLEAGLVLGQFAVSATSEARWPPAEPPVTTRKSGFAPYSGPCVRIQAIARFRSTSGSGRSRAGSGDSWR
jgi:hypothetical protein